MNMVKGENNAQQVKLPGMQANTSSRKDLTLFFITFFCVCVQLMTTDRHTESPEEELCILRLYSTSRLELSTEPSQDAFHSNRLTRECSMVFMGYLLLC